MHSILAFFLFPRARFSSGPKSCQNRSDLLQKLLFPHSQTQTLSLSVVVLSPLCSVFSLNQNPARSTPWTCARTHIHQTNPLCTVCQIERAAVGAALKTQTRSSEFDSQLCATDLSRVSHKTELPPWGCPMKCCRTVCRLWYVSLKMSLGARAYLINSKLSPRDGSKYKKRLQEKI